MKSRALNKLLDKFDKTVFDYYQPPEQGELVELSKNILYGKPEDDLNSIKNAFTRLSVTLKENDIYVKFGNEAPIILLDHMLSPKQPPVTGITIHSVISYFLKYIDTRRNLSRAKLKIFYR